MKRSSEERRREKWRGEEREEEKEKKAFAVRGRGASSSPLCSVWDPDPPPQRGQNPRQPLASCRLAPEGVTVPRAALKQKLYTVNSGLSCQRMYVDSKTVAHGGF